jgi:hypothetical protein
VRPARWGPWERTKKGLMAKKSNRYQDCTASETVLQRIETALKQSFNLPMAHSYCSYHCSVWYPRTLENAWFSIESSVNVLTSKAHSLFGYFTAPLDAADEIKVGVPHCELRIDENDKLGLWVTSPRFNDVRAAVNWLRKWGPLHCPILTKETAEFLRTSKHAKH